ncbi:MAG: Maf-like protein [Phocaeicola sp.]
MLKNLENYKLFLASQSPRRKELLAGLGVDFEVRILADIDESYPNHLVGEEIPRYIANAKAKAYIETIQPGELVITADTIVWKEGEVLGKPNDAEDAKRMLRTLSGETHQVLTGVCLVSTDFQKEFVSSTHVTFATLSEEEITYYVDRFLPLDKAGSYGIQEWIGFIGVKKIKGSYFNVMGLPIQQLYEELKQV